MFSMAKNMGTLDRAVRTFLAIIFLALYQTEVAAGITGTLMAILGIMFLCTSVVSHCPLYTLFGFTTCPPTQKQ